MDRNGQLHNVRERLANLFLNNYIGKYLEIPEADLLFISLRKILLGISPFFLPGKRKTQNPNFMATKKSKQPLLMTRMVSIPLDNISISDDLKIKLCQFRVFTILWNNQDSFISWPTGNWFLNNYMGKYLENLDTDLLSRSGHVLSRARRFWR